MKKLKEVPTLQFPFFKDLDTWRVASIDVPRKKREVLKFI